MNFGQTVPSCSRNRTERDSFARGGVRSERRASTLRARRGGEADWRVLGAIQDSHPKNPNALPVVAFGFLRVVKAAPLGLGGAPGLCVCQHSRCGCVGDLDFQLSGCRSYLQL